MDELGNQLPTEGSSKDTLQETLEESLQLLLDQVIEGLNRSADRNDRIDITEVAYDILTQDPHLRAKVINNETLTGVKLDDLEDSDRYYLKINKKVWLFSLKELNDLLNLQESLVITNPYTLEPFDEETINSIKRRIKYNTEFADFRNTAHKLGTFHRIERSEYTEDGEESKSEGRSEGRSALSNSSDSLLTADTVDQSDNREEVVNVHIPRNESFNVSHNMTEFLHRVSHLGCYPDINAFKQLKWDQIVEFVKRLLKDWPDFMNLGSNDTRLIVDYSPSQSSGPAPSPSQDEHESEREKLERILNSRVMTDSGNPALVIHEDQKTIVRFLTRLVTQNDNNDSSRALLFTTELSSYLAQLNFENQENEDDGDRPDSGFRRSELQPEETYELLLARLRAQPDNETFVQQVRFIIEHIVEMNTYSLSNSLSSGTSTDSTTSTSTTTENEASVSFTDA